MVQDLRNNQPEGTRLIQCHNKMEGGEMKSKFFGIQSHQHSQSIGEQARWLMSQSRQEQQNRQQAMLYRAAVEVGINS
jgi:hypothetical protein